jgi:RimJ/RimL family protein N-acetyltransferase
MEKYYNVKVTDDSKEAFYYASNDIPYIVLLNNANKTSSFPNGAYCVENPDDIDEYFKEKVYRRFRNLPWEIAQTSRLLIREITLEDVPRLYDIYSDESITRYMEPLFPSMDKELEYTKNYIENIYKFYGYGMWVIVEQTSGLVVGRVGFEYKEGFDGLELGFMLGVDYQHKGYAYEACQAVLEYAREELCQNNFCAYVDEDNMQSIRLLRKLGFETEGERDKNYIRFLKKYNLY